ncbi:MAG: hypothetical protein RI894_1794, partial [Bacteroidota bacterium]
MLSRLQLVPKLDGAARVRNTNRASNHICYRKNLENLVGCHAFIAAFFEVI